MKNKPTAGIAAAVLGLLTAFIPQVIFPVCTSMLELTNGRTLFMRCRWTARVEVPIGILIVCVGIMLMAFKKHETHFALSVMLFLLGLIVLLIPTAVIGMCETVTMACRVGTEPGLIVVSVIIMMVAIGNMFIHISAVRAEKQRRERRVVE